MRMRSMYKARSIGKASTITRYEWAHRARARRVRYIIVLIIVVVTMETAILLVEITNALK